MAVCKIKNWIFFCATVLCSKDSQHHWDATFFFIKPEHLGCKDWNGEHRVRAKHWARCAEMSEANFTRNKSPAAIIFQSAIIFFTWVFECHRQFLGQKIIADGYLYLVKLVTDQEISGRRQNMQSKINEHAQLPTHIVPHYAHICSVPTPMLKKTKNKSSTKLGWSRDSSLL